MNSSDFRQKFFYAFGQFGNGVYNGFNNAILSLFVSSFTGNPFIIGYLSNTRTVEGVVIQPVVGRISDRTTSPLGRRRPFILFGIPISVFFLLLVPVAGHIHLTVGGVTITPLALVFATIVLFSITWNIAGDPYQALMIDITGERERSVYNAILSIVSLVGQVAILAYAAIAAFKKDNIPPPVFYACAIFLLLSYAVVFFGVREPKHAAASASKEERIPLRTYIAGIRQFREAFKLLVSIFFLWTGLNAIIPFLTVFVRHVMHGTDSQALIVYMVIILSAGAFAYPFGWLGKRYGNRRFIIVGTVLLVIAAIWGLLVPSYIWLFPLAVLAGCGFSATTVLTYPYLSQLVPGSKIGLFTGLQTAFSAAAVPLSVILTGVLVDLWGYRSIFAMLGIMMLFDIAFLLAVNDTEADLQVHTVEEAEQAMAQEVAPLPAI